MHVLNARQQELWRELCRISRALDSGNIFKWHRPKSLYIHGSVGKACFLGTGKTMLMDRFYNNVSSTSKIRLHHNQLLPCLIENKTPFAQLICYDEVQMREIGEAMLLRRFFESALQNGTFLVCTSNLHPSELYKHGARRELLVPCLDLILSRMHVFDLNGPDYRSDRCGSNLL